MQKFSKKHIWKITQKVAVWIARQYCLEKGPLSAHRSWKPWTKSGHPFATALISFLAHRRFTAHPCTCSRVVLTVCCWEGRIVITPDWSCPFLSLLSFVSAVQTAFCHSCQWTTNQRGREDTFKKCVRTTVPLLGKIRRVSLPNTLQNKFEIDKTVKLRPQNTRKIK